RQMRIEAVTFAFEALRAFSHRRGIGRAEFQDLLDQPLEDQRLASFAAPVLQLPALPAHDVAAGARIVRPQRIGLAIREVLHDRSRLPEHKVAFDQRRRAAGWIEREVGWGALLALA